MCIRDREEVWQQLRAWFGEKSDGYEELVQKSGGMLEHAFDFMEAAFGDSQEMVMFVTELNSRYYSCLLYTLDVYKRQDQL